MTKDPGQLLIDFCDRCGLDAEDFCEVLDKGMIVAERIDGRLQSCVDTIARKQYHNADMIRILAASFTLQWALMDAVFDWGWDVDDDLEPADIVGAMMLAGLDVIHQNRVAPKGDDNE